MFHRDMTLPAPARMSVELGNGRYFSKPWDAAGVQAYKQIGGWFLSGKHDFDSPGTARLAGVRGEERVES